MPQSQNNQDTVNVPGPDGKTYRFPKGTTPERAQAYFDKKGIGKPSAAVGAQQPRAIPGPGGVGTNYTTGPRAGTPPPVAGAGGAGMPAGGAPPNTQGFGATGMADVSIGMAKRGGQELINMLQMGGSPVSDLIKSGMQTQPGQSLSSMLQPKGSLQEFGSDASDVLQYMIPVGGEEKFAAKAGELAERYIPKVVQGLERKAAQDGLLAILSKVGLAQGEQIAKAAYQSLTGAATGAIQGRDAAKSGAEAGGISLLLGNLGKLSPPLLRSLFNVKDIRGGDTGEMLTKLSGLTRGKLTKNSIKELQDVEGRISRSMNTKIPHPTIAGGHTGTTFNISTILDAVEKKTFDSTVPVGEAQKIKNLLKEVERFSDSVAPGRVKILQAQVGKKTEEVIRLSDKLKSVTSQSVIDGINAAIDKRIDDIDGLKKLLRNQPTLVSSIKLNNFRKLLDEKYMPYGKDPSSWTEGEKLVKWVHDQITEKMKQGRPEIDRMLKDSYSLRDIKGAMLKEERKSFGLHTIMDPAALPRTLPPWVAWEVGHKTGGPVLGLMGAVAAGSARAPMAAGAKMMASPFSKGAATGISNLLSNEPESVKPGKKTPYGPME